MKTTYHILNWLNNNGINFNIVDCNDGEGNIIIETPNYNFITQEYEHEVFLMVDEGNLEPFNMNDINFLKWGR